MKDFRVRAWDKKTNTFVYLYIEQGSIRLPGMHLELTDLENWQLYTGLLDRSGVPIFEGDIITGWKGSNDPAAVELEPEGDFWYWTGEYGGEEDYEVIGNIYENKDLLNED